MTQEQQQEQQHGQQELSLESRAGRSYFSMELWVTLITPIRIGCDTCNKKQNTTSGDPLTLFRFYPHFQVNLNFITYIKLLQHYFSKTIITPKTGIESKHGKGLKAINTCTEQCFSESLVGYRLKPYMGKTHHFGWFRQPWSHVK